MPILAVLGTPSVRNCVAQRVDSEFSDTLLGESRSGGAGLPATPKGPGSGALPSVRGRSLQACGSLEKNIF